MKKTGENKIESIGTFLIVQWLGLRAFTAGAWVQSLVGELRKIPGMCCVVKKKKSLMARIHRRTLPETLMTQITMMAMTKNVQTTAQLHSFHTIAK